jgi:hypothetical protein
MDADESLGTDPVSRRPGQTRAPVEAESPYGRPIPSVRRDVSARRQYRKEAPGPREGNLAASFPLIFFGAGCLAVALFVLLEGSRAAIGRIPLWVPFVALGVIALAGGILSVFAEPDEDTSAVVPDEEGPSTLPLPPVRYLIFDRESRSEPSGDAPRPETSPVSTKVSRAVSPEPKLEAKGPPPRPVAAPSPSPAPAAVNALNADEAASLLKEIDLIDAELHASRIGRRSAASANPGSSPSPASRAPVPGVPIATATAKSAPKGNVAPAPARRESDTPRQVARCVGCGSVILHSGSPSRCQACGEPLCPECRDRSIAEGKPNLCPLCGLLDSVHTRPVTTSQPGRART